MDVIASSDGALVVIHDDTLDRTTSGTGCVGSMTLADLKKVDAAKGTSLEGTGVQLSTFTRRGDPGRHEGPRHPRQLV
jgi:glycerophosphoryl diester phosphodiesterase